MTMDRELGWDKAPTVREIEKLDDITYFGKFSKLGEKILFTSVNSFIRLFYQIYKDGSSMSEKQYEKSEPRNQIKLFVTLPN